MPYTTPTPASVYLHCRSPRCGGANQEEVPGIREETFWSFGDRSGETGWLANVVENSLVEFKVEDPDVLPCPVCSESREISGTARPQYQNLSGHDPMGLVGGLTFDPNRINTESDAKVAELEAKLNKLLAEKEAA